MRTPVMLRLPYQSPNHSLHPAFDAHCCLMGTAIKQGVPWRQSHRISGLANLPSVGAVP